MRVTPRSGSLHQKPYVCVYVCVKGRDREVGPCCDHLLNSINFDQSVLDLRAALTTKAILYTQILRLTGNALCPPTPPPPKKSHGQCCSIGTKYIMCPVFDLFLSLYSSSDLGGRREECQPCPHQVRLFNKSKLPDGPKNDRLK